MVLFGEIWKSLSTATPQNISTNTRNASPCMASPTEGKAPLYQPQATTASFPKAGAPGVTPPAQFPGAPAEDSDGSWVAAMIIGIILMSIIMAIVIIFLWKCRRRPGLAYSHWAGRSPFADGDAPDVLMDSDQAIKRSSALFMLPWKFKQDPNLQQELTVAEQPPDCTTCNENSELPPLVDDLAAAGIPASNTGASPAPIPEATGCAEDSVLTQPLHMTPQICPLLRTGSRNHKHHGSDLSKNWEFHPEPEEPLPSPPELLIQEIHNHCHSHSSFCTVPKFMLVLNEVLFSQLKKGEVEARRNRSPQHRHFPSVS